MIMNFDKNNHGDAEQRIIVGGGTKTPTSNVVTSSKVETSDLTKKAASKSTTASGSRGNKGSKSVAGPKNAVNPATSDGNSRSSNKADEIVHSVTSYDVLLGRGTGPNEHEGNVYFRSLVREALDKHAATHHPKTDVAASAASGISSMIAPPPMNPKVKAQLAKEILEKVQSQGGRFVRIVDATSTVKTRESSSTSVAPGPKAGKGDGKASKGTSIANRDCLFVVVTDAVALDKIKQSFRHQRRLLSPKASSRSPTAATVASVAPLTRAVSQVATGTAATPSPISVVARHNTSAFDVPTTVPGGAVVSIPTNVLSSSLDPTTSSLLQSMLQSRSLGTAHNPTLNSLTATALQLERMKQELETELLMKVYANRLATATNNGIPQPSTVQSLGSSSSSSIASSGAVSSATTGAASGLDSTLIGRLISQGIDPRLLLSETNAAAPSQSVLSSVRLAQQGPLLGTGNPTGLSGGLHALTVNSIASLPANASISNQATRNTGLAGLAPVPSIALLRQEPRAEQQQQQQQMGAAQNMSSAQTYLNMAAEILRQWNFPKNK